MLRYKTETRPGLVALYDIRPGNGAGQFLQPRSPHGAPGLNTLFLVDVYATEDSFLPSVGTFANRTLVDPCDL